MKEGLVFNIQKFSINDGPGIRTTVFLKGCPLQCVWCHNPESQVRSPEIFFRSNKCILCGKCATVCTQQCHDFDEEKHIYKREACIACGKCAVECPVNALELVGEYMSAQTVLECVRKDKVFYDNSGGGLTISGGEPMSQFDFSYELLKAAKEEGLHTCMETCGFAKPEQFRKIAPYVDIFLFDYKETVASKHKEYTGVSNELILNNLMMLDNLGAKIILRCPIIPTYNDREEHFEGIARIANTFQNIIEVNIEPYHPMGSSKADMLSKEYLVKDLSIPDKKTVQSWIGGIASETAVPVKKA